MKKVKDHKTDEKKIAEFSKEELIAMVFSYEKRCNALLQKLNGANSKLAKAHDTIKIQKQQLDHCRKKIIAFRYPHGSML
jgi:hypothetical protein